MRPAEHLRPRLRVLIADDQPHMRRMLRHALGATGEFDVVGEASNGHEALAMLRQLNPDIALLDLKMPVLDGVETIRAMRRAGLTTRALVLTAHQDRDLVTAAVEAGADGYVLKGCSSKELRAAVRDVAGGGAVLAPAVARGLVEEYAQMLEEKRARDLAVIRTLASAVEARDPLTGDHAHNVAELSIALWHAMVPGNGEDELLYGFLLHDVGKIAIPDAILLKPGPLTHEEFAIMRRHPEIGVDLVGPLGFRPVVLEVIRHHHERWDGNGYPSGLAGGGIPVHARIFSVVDAFDAMTTNRPYRNAMPRDDALEEIRRNSGTQFDPDVVTAFERLASGIGLVA